MVDLVVREAGLGKGLGPATRNACDVVRASIWLTIGVSTLSPVRRRQTGFCGKSLVLSAATRIKAPPPSGHQTTLQQPERVGDHRRVQYILDRAATESPR